MSDRKVPLLRGWRGSHPLVSAQLDLVWGKVSLVGLITSLREACEPCERMAAWIISCTPQKASTSITCKQNMLSLSIHLAEKALAEPLQDINLDGYHYQR